MEREKSSNPIVEKPRNTILSKGLRLKSTVAIHVDIIYPPYNVRIRPPHLCGISPKTITNVLL